MMEKLTSEHIKKIHELDRMWLLLGTLISADTLVEEKDYEISRSLLENLSEAIQDADIDEEAKKQYMKYVRDGLKLVNDEYEERFGKKDK